MHFEEGPAAGRRGAAWFLRLLPRCDTFLIVHQRPHPAGLGEIARDLYRAGHAKVRLRRATYSSALLIVDGVRGRVVRMTSLRNLGRGFCIGGMRGMLWVRANGAPAEFHHTVHARTAGRRQAHRIAAATIFAVLA